MRLWVLTFDESKFEDESPHSFSWGEARHATDAEIAEARKEPLLGLATTRELLREISARIEVGGVVNDSRGLDYRNSR
jgi:hypothetical protein